ncbi:MAG: hypothetical protein JKY43_03660 [Phycisphaerales bacterium]|nr:hypothetical protein [Phycisphaerales bacterium]
MNTYGPLILLSLAFALILGVQVFFTLYIGYTRTKPIAKSTDPKPIVIPNEPTR